MPIKSGDTVIVEYTGRIVSDGDEENLIFDTSRESVAEEAELPSRDPEADYKPLTAVVGEGDIHEGLEEALLGREEGDSFTITLSPEEAYGEWTEDKVREYDVDELEEMIGGYTPASGAILTTKDGRRVQIDSVEDGTARVDFNHPLTDQTLEFDVEVASVEKPAQ